MNNLAKQAIHDKLESQINTAEAKLNTLKRRAETAKANGSSRGGERIRPGGGTAGGGTSRRDCVPVARNFLVELP